MQGHVRRRTFQIDSRKDRITCLPWRENIFWHSLCRLSLLFGWEIRKCDIKVYCHSFVECHRFALIMSNPDPPLEASSPVQPNNDTLITIASNTSNNNAPATIPTTSATTSSEPNNDEMNSSIGSQRSLNRSIFPFRFNRDLLISNVSWSTCCVLGWLMNVIKNEFLFVQVFQEIRPLVNTSSTNAPFASWMRSSIHSVHSDEHSTQTEHTARVQDVEAGTGAATGTDNVIINFGSPSTSYGRQNSAPARTGTETGADAMGTASTNQSRNSLQQHQSSDSTNSTGSDDPNAPETGADSLTQIPEARAFINTISRYFPYVCILFAKSCYDHLDGILDIFALFVVFAHSNFTLKQEITKQQGRRFLYLIRELVYIVIVVTIIGFILEKKDTFISLFFAPIKFPPPGEEKTLALKDLLFSVCITDLILKLVTVALKILFTMFPRKAVEFKNRVSCITRSRV